MKAIIHSQFGPPEELQLKEIPKPAPKDNEILIKIHASTVTSTDCNARNYTFVPDSLRWVGKMMFGFKTPKVNILGTDLAGEVVAVGKDVTRFKKGDHVFGTPEPAFGAHAEFACLPEDAILIKKPINITWEEVAAIPLAGSTALYYIRDLGKVQAGQNVLINGASGAIGTFAVQLAKFYKARVTAVCSTSNIEMVKALGADKVIDYTKEDFREREEKYDVIFDVVTKTSFSDCKKLLKKSGIFLGTGIGLGELILMPITSLFGGKKVKGGAALSSTDGLVFLKDLMEAGMLKSVIDRTYPLEKMVDAFRYVEKGHKKGNVVIAV